MGALINCVPVSLVGLYPPTKRRPSGGQRDNVEAIDMEMSDEDFDDSHLQDSFDSFADEGLCILYA